MTTADLLARFQTEHIERHSISAHRATRTFVTLLALAARLDGRTLAELTPSDLMSWQSAELRRGLQPSTLGNREGMVRAFITWATTAGVIGFEQSARLKSVSPVRGGRVGFRPKPYKRSEVIRLREALAERYPLAPQSGPGSRMIARYLSGQSSFKGVIYNHARRLQLEAQVSLALEEGLRCQEVYDLTLAHMHPDNAAVVVRTAKQKPGDARYREVPWTSHSRESVAEWLEFRALLTPEHERPWLALWWEAPTAPQRFRTFADKSLLPFDTEQVRYRWHRLRHTFATERLRAGMPLEKVQVMMGHANLAQTLAYAEIVNADVVTEAERTDEAFARLLGLT